MNELLVNYRERTVNNQYCHGCGSLSDEQYPTYIYWHKYRMRVVMKDLLVKYDEITYNYEYNNYFK